MVLSYQREVTLSSASLPSSSHCSSGSLMSIPPKGDPVIPLRNFLLLLALLLFQESHQAPSLQTNPSVQFEKNG